MTHYMSLHPQPFKMIECGSKTIELRLLDEKRKSIQVGDELIFKNTADASTTLSCKVKKLHIFADFEELYQTLPLDKCGYLPEELATASAKDMEIYYSADKQLQYGVVGIELELL